MTLQEYVAQTEPIKHPNVLLKESEVEIKYLWTDVMGVSFYSVTIPLLHEMFNVSATYLKRSDEWVLWTIDSDGNKKRPSVFYLQTNILRQL